MDHSASGGEIKVSQLITMCEAEIDGIFKKRAVFREKMIQEFMKVPRKKWFLGKVYYQTREEAEAIFERDSNDAWSPLCYADLAKQYYRNVALEISRRLLKQALFLQSRNPDATMFVTTEDFLIFGKDAA